MLKRNKPLHYSKVGVAGLRLTQLALTCKSRARSERAANTSRPPHLLHLGMVLHSSTEALCETWRKRAHSPIYSHFCGAIAAL